MFLKRSIEILCFKIFLISIFQLLTIYSPNAYGFDNNVSYSYETSSVKNEANRGNISEHIFYEVSSLPEEPPILQNVLVRFCDSSTIERIGKAEDYIVIPTLSSATFNYSLNRIRIKSSNQGEWFYENKTFNFTEATIISSHDFHRELRENTNDSKIIFKLLRKETLLLDTGYLSVGFDGRVAIYYPPEEYCIDEIRGSGKNVVVKFKACKISEDRPVFRKCCPLNMIFKDGLCISSLSYDDGDKDFEYLNVSNMMLKQIKDVDEVYTSPLLDCGKDMVEVWEEDGCKSEFYPTTDNRVAYIGAHRKWEFLDKDSGFCMEKEVNENNQVLNMLIRCLGNETTEANMRSAYQARISLIYMISMFIGAIFNLLTALTYLITWNKQNIHGKTLCSCTASLFFMQLFLGNSHLMGKVNLQRKAPLCVVNGIFAQFFMIAAFTWLLVVNFDLWRTFRLIRIDESKDSKQFRKYYAFGWGFPILVILISVCMEISFSCRVSGVPVPEYGDHICFVAPWSQGIYVYYILSILMAMTVMFSALTLFGLYNYKKDTNNLRSTKLVKDKQNIFLFLKLSVLMGLTWIFEVISWASAKGDVSNVGWIILDLYNALSSILIFVIFVCKRSVYDLVKPSVLTLNILKKRSEVDVTHL